jgi:hypothetical protein
LEELDQLDKVRSSSTISDSNRQQKTLQSTHYKRHSLSTESLSTSTTSSSLLSTSTPLTFKQHYPHSIAHIKRVHFTKLNQSIDSFCLHTTHTQYTQTRYGETKE